MSFFVTTKPDRCLKCTAASVDANGNERVAFLYADSEGLFAGCPTYTCLYCGAQHFVEEQPSLSSSDTKRERGGYHISNGVKL